jgi:hypothetical protein
MTAKFFVDTNVLAYAASNDLVPRLQPGNSPPRGSAS